MKSIAIKTALSTAVDKLAFKRDFEVKQVAVDMTNLAVTEYFTRDTVLGFTESILSGMSDVNRERIVSVVLDVAQDMIFQRLMKTESRSLMHSMVTFAVAELGEEQIASRLM